MTKRNHMLEQYNPDNYRKTDKKTSPKSVGQVFFLAKGTKPVVVSTKIEKSHGFSVSNGEPRNKVTWHYQYLRKIETDYVYGSIYAGQHGRSLEGVQMIEAEYTHPEGKE